MALRISSFIRESNDLSGLEYIIQGCAKRNPVKLNSAVRIKTTQACFLLVGLVAGSMRDHKLTGAGHRRSQGKLHNPEQDMYLP